MTQDNSRRGFLKKMLVGAAVFPILNNMKIDEVRAQVPNKALDENDPMAKTMGYYHDAKKVDKAKWTKKAGPDGDKQLCKNCVLYLEGGKKVDGQPGEWGRCGLFPNGLVNAEGWCNSYAQKVGA